MEISKCFCRTQHDVFYNQSAKNFILFNTWERRQIITKQKKKKTKNFQLTLKNVFLVNKFLCYYIFDIYLRYILEIIESM